MLSFTIFFLQNLHYSYIQEHLTPSASTCIFPGFFMINQLCQKKNATNTFKYHVFARMGRFQLELIYLYRPSI